MFEIGFWELALLFALGLVVLGPEKLPKVASQLGRYAGQARRMARTLTTQIRDEIDAEERRASAAERRTATPEPDAAPEPAPEAATYSRPGADDLIPRQAPEPLRESVAADARMPDDPADTVHRPQA